ncbi:hypothetical protein [Sinomicrobium sp. M5D2P17]
MKKNNFISVLFCLGALLTVISNACSKQEDVSDAVTNIAEDPDAHYVYAAVADYVGGTFGLKASNNLFVSGENGQSAMYCDRPAADAWEHFTIVDAGGGLVALRSMGKYVSSENGTQPMRCNRTSIEDWEKFTLVEHSDGTISFRGNNGKYVSSEDGEEAMYCDRDAVEGWEKFTLVPVNTLPPGGTWRQANLTNFTSYPEPGSEECEDYNGCLWAGYFAFVDGKMPESWVESHNIIAVHSRDGDTYALKTFRIRQGNRTIDATVYDICSDNDCGGCCTTNADAGGIGFLIDVEKYTMQRFGSGSGVVEWMCLDCD